MMDAILKDVAHNHIAQVTGAGFGFLENVIIRLA